jgi:hypothetical protein
MFKQGFEKIALKIPAIGKILAQPARASRFVGGIPSRIGKSELAQSVKGGYREALRGEKPAIGASVAKSQKGKRKLSLHNEDFRKLNPEERRNAVVERAKKMNATKPSFAHRHPLLTAGGAVIGYRAAFGGKDREETPPPQVMYPQQ